MGECVKVITRCRPMNDREFGLKSKNVVRMDTDVGQCSLTNPSDGSAPPKLFSFDGVYYVDSTTEAIYLESTYPLVESFLEGYNATVFAYGQTGCGKSFTMQGIQHSAFEHIFEAIESSDNIKFLVHASYLEIYNEDVRDLLAKDTKLKLELKEHPEKGVYVQGLNDHPVHNVEECEQLMEKGWRNRATGSTNMNSESSRSHSIFTITIETMDNDQRIRKGKLNLVDLAGSERQAKTGASGDRLKEATKINLSLSALGNVISALVDGKSKHIPYRDSKLTRLLQDSLGGNTKTAMIACISPAGDNYDETLSTLRYANRAKNIKNKPKINQDPKDALLNEYQDEIRLLRELLERQRNGDHDSGINMSCSSASDSGAEEEKERIRQEYEHQLEELRQSYEAEKLGRARLQQDVETIKEQYKRELNQFHINLDKEVHSDDSGNCSGQSLSPEQQEALQRLQEIEENMVGGERAHDTALKEKLQKKRKAAEKRTKLKLAAEALLNEDEDTLLIKAYDNIQEELRVKNEALKKSKQKVRASEREISDLYSEFQADRTDYLETIRRQDQQIKLFQAILDKIQPTIRRDCNYSNLDGIKVESIWSDENQRWKLPDLILIKTKLPPAGIPQNNNRVSSKTAPPRINSDNEDDLDDFTNSNLIKKFEANEEVLQNYFKQKRTSELLIRAQEDASRVLKKWSDMSNTKNGGINNNKGLNGNHLEYWNNHFNTALTNLSSSGSANQNQNGKISEGKNSSNTWTPSPVHHQNMKDQSEITLVRRPIKLEALQINPNPTDMRSQTGKSNKNLANTILPNSMSAMNSKSIKKLKPLQVKDFSQNSGEIST